MGRKGSMKVGDLVSAGRRGTPTRTVFANAMTLPLPTVVETRISSSTTSTRNPPCATASWGEIDQNKELYITQQQKTKPKHSQC